VVVPSSDCISTVYMPLASSEPSLKDSLSMFDFRYIQFAVAFSNALNYTSRRFAGPLAEKMIGFVAED
jgi:hypothetical protein